jgi:DNA-binding ferritin-like protein
MQTPQRTLLKRPQVGQSMVQTASNGCDSAVANMVSELMNAGTSLHKLHLRVQGPGSYAAHKALNELYDAMPGHADDLAEGYQGAACCILQYTEVAPATLSTVEEAIAYLKSLKDAVTSLQGMMPYSEIVNDLDTIKSTLNSGIYKLTYLK